MTTVTPTVESGTPAPAIEKLAFSVSEVAPMLGLCEESIYRLAARGKLKRVSGIRHLRFTRKAIENFLNAN